MIFLNSAIARTQEKVTETEHTESEKSKTDESESSATIVLYDDNSVVYI